MGKGKEKEQQHEVPAWGQENYNTSIDENKKWMHRETERQRREEMGKHCATLRSLLPLEYIKGKRSISDHMYEAVNYINHLQNKVEQMQAKRDELKKVFDLSSSTVEPESESSSTHLPPYVVVHPLQGGVEIMCSYSFRECVFPLSSLLHIVIGEGLNVVNSISTIKNGRSIHTIRSEDPNMTGIDYSDLQRKLTEAISSSSSLTEITSYEPQNCLYLDS